jgi:hypothetical protein
LSPVLDDLRRAMDGLREGTVDPKVATAVSVSICNASVEGLNGTVAPVGAMGAGEEVAGAVPCPGFSP